MSREQRAIREQCPPLTHTLYLPLLTLKKKSDNFFAGLAPTYFRLLKLHSASAAV